MTEQAKKRKSKYTDQFEADAVRLVIGEELPVAQVARDLGMPANTLHKRFVRPPIRGMHIRWPTTCSPGSLRPTP